MPDDKLSLAIGKNGQNVRLAARLSHCKIDVKSESQMEGIILKKPTEQQEIHIDESVNLDDMFKDDDEK